MNSTTMKKVIYVDFANPDKGRGIYKNTTPCNESLSLGAMLCSVFNVGLMGYPKEASVDARELATSIERLVGEKIKCRFGGGKIQVFYA